MTSALRRLGRRVLALFRRDALDRDFDEEVQNHIELAIDDYVSQGLTRADATRLARAKFGLIEASRDSHRRARSLVWVETLAFELRQARRSLWAAKGFALTVIATMTVAVALNTSVFVIMDAVLFRGFPLVTDHRNVVFLQERGPQNTCCMSYLDFEDWQAEATSFAGMAFVRSQRYSFRDDAGRPSDISGTQLSTNAFSVLGVSPMLGRDFMPADRQAGATPVIILSHRLWQSRFQGRTDVIGATVRLDERPATVIGVMPERFEFPLRIIGDFWMPVPDTPQVRNRGLDGGFMVIARLRDGVTAVEAHAELETINGRLAIERPDTNRNVVPRLASHSEWNSGPDAPLIWGSLFVASCFVLLIACANLANLALIRTLGRGRDLATRLALGAGPRRVALQLGIECGVLGALSATMAWGLVKAAVGTWDEITFSLYQVLDYSVDARAFSYLAAVTLLSTMLMAMAPILRVKHAAASEAMKAGARGVTTGPRGKRLGSALIAAQMALAIVLLAGAGVIIRSFDQIVGADAGVRGGDQALVALMWLPSADYARPEDRAQYLDRLQLALRNAPGVEQVALATTSPTRQAALRAVEVEGRLRQPGDERVGVVRVTSGYLDIIGARLLDGRAFTDADQSGTRPVAIVNQAFADRYWPGQSAIGRRIRYPLGRDVGEWREVVGVASNVMYNDPLRQTFKPIVHVPLTQEPLGLQIYWFAQTSQPAARMASAIRPVAEAVDPHVGLQTFSTLTGSFAFDRDFMDAEHSELGKYAKVAPIFAGVALVLSALGLIAVIAHSVGQREKEIGVRMAIGATGTDIRRLILREGLSPVVLGVAAGLAVSLAANRLLESQLVGVSPYDPAVMVGAPLILALIAAAASVLPARRAAAVDPVVALRSE